MHEKVFIGVEIDKKWVFEARNNYCIPSKPVKFEDKPVKFEDRPENSECKPEYSKDELENLKMSEKIGEKL